MRSTLRTDSPWSIFNRHRWSILNRYQHRKALNRQLKDRTNGALYFHHRKVVPSWSNEYMKTVEIEDFLFYKPAGAKAK
nr:cell wall hydrolase [Nitrosomonas ureae]